MLSKTSRDAEMFELLCIRHAKDVNISTRRKMSIKKTSKNSDAIPDQSAFFIGGPIIIYACYSHTNDLVEN